MVLKVTLHNFNINAFKSKSILVCSILIFSCFKNINSQVNVNQLLRESENYYLTLKKFVVNVKIESKNLIRVDTTISERTCIVDKEYQLQLFKTLNSGLFRQNEEEYSINYKTNSYQKIKNNQKKYTGYWTQFRFYPFISFSNFFTSLSRDIQTNKYKIEENETYYILFTADKSVAIRKIDKSIQSVTTKEYDKLNKGYEFNKVSFTVISDIDTISENLLYNAIKITENRLNEYVTSNAEQNKKINRDSLEFMLQHLRNPSFSSLSGKMLLLDFFYQGCYPCIKSYPLLNQLNNNKDSNLIIIGIDPVLKDSATIDLYIKKYDLSYPILVGINANYLAQYFNISTYPTYLLIDPNGNVIDSDIGFTKATLRKMLRN